MRSRVLCGAVMLAACASNSALPERSGQQTVQVVGMAGKLTINSSSTAGKSTIAAPIEQVWRVLPAVFDSLFVPVSTADPAGHVIGNPGFKVRQRLGKASLSRYFDCGQTQIGPNADSYDVILTVMLQLQPGASGATDVITTVDASAKPVAFAQAPSACSSKGALETRILSLIEKATSR